eukprot:CAMPEP_0118834866 /NCGR_PEP_ID=MMETSP1162-20130426/51750_1 /TAXON_ID=33656 /ORGANISM="Phaeocystis Sp, Strain CCMP2710" /LENGTH=52 /DNA_ID=CAMNT_0006766603 /DNA_START=110 /DNA_END=265 /DNA_ORIENTATION=-
MPPEAARRQAAFWPARLSHQPEHPAAASAGGSAVARSSSVAMRVRTFPGHEA